MWLPFTRSRLSSAIDPFTPSHTSDPGAHVLLPGDGQRPRAGPGSADQHDAEAAGIRSREHADTIAACVREIYVS